MGIPVNYRLAATLQRRITIARASLVNHDEIKLARDISIVSIRKFSVTSKELSVWTNNQADAQIHAQLRAADIVSPTHHDLAEDRFPHALQTRHFCKL